jgi:hypothetical protein
MEKVNYKKAAEKWAYERTNKIKKILSFYRINKTGKLSRSTKFKFVGTDKGLTIEFYQIFYGAYVEAYWLKYNLDILKPIRDVSELLKIISTGYKNEIIKDFKRTLEK